MHPRRSSPLVLALLIVGGLPAAGPVAAAGTPEGAVDALLDAIVARDPAAIEAATCQGFAGAVTAAFDPIGGLSADGADSTTRAAAATLRIEDRSVALVEETGEAATVAVEGQLRAEIEPDVARAWVVTRLDAAGQPSDPAAADASLDGFLAALTDGRDLGSTAEVVRTDGDWRVCSGLGITTPGDPAPVRADLCALASVEAVATATGLPLTEAWPSEDACTWASETGTSDPFSITALLLDGELAPLQAVWKPGRDIEIAGQTAWATRNGTWVQLDGGLLAILPTLEWSDATRDADPMATAVSVAELLVPRLP